MSSSSPDRAESVRQRLRNVMRTRGDDVQFGLQRYAVERLLYRLGSSRHRDRFILKGAALFALWGGPVYRPTRDVDFTGYGSPDEREVLAAFREICVTPGEDLLRFDASTTTAEQIRDESEYSGLRVRLVAALGESRIPVQIDIGFADAIDPPPWAATYPTMLDEPAPHILAYPVEAVVAEKVHAMAILGARNSRYKDFYDVQAIARQFAFDGRLAQSIAATFARRRTDIGVVRSAALSAAFYENEGRAAQWRAYVSRNNLPGTSADFALVGETIAAFLGPLSAALISGEPLNSVWEAGGPWRARS